jgi:FkbM family methyltransferase
VIEGLGPQTACARRIGDSLGDSVFTLLDIGCSGGIDDAWRAFGKHLRTFAFDPNLAEVQRLTKQETHPGVVYVHGFVGLPPDDKGYQRLFRGDFWARNPWGRLSSTRTQEIKMSRQVHSEKTKTRNQWHEVALADPTKPVVIPVFLRERGVVDVDFIKLDVDGADYLILRSLERLLADAKVLGVAAEVNFFGSEDEEIHTFHNLDRFMKRCGFELFALSTRQGSVAALPAPYRRHFPAFTKWGRILQCDAIYFRDAAAAEQAEWASSAGPYKLAKLAASFSLAQLPDCAAEVVQSFRPSLQTILNVDASLDALVQQGLAADGPAYSYGDYLEKFEADASCFYPQQGKRDA